MRITPNHITFLRIALIPAFVAALLTRLDHEYGTIIAVAIFSIAAASDGIDGWLARSRGEITTLGVLLDPLADKLLITAALVGLMAIGELGPPEIAAPVVLIILSREFAVTGLRAVAAAHGDVIAAGRLGKLKTVSQIAMVLVLIPTNAPEMLGAALIALAVTLTAVSGIEYFWNGREILRSERSAPQ